MAIDHMSVLVPQVKFKACLAFYLAALKPLGYDIVHNFGEIVGLGTRADDPLSADLWLIASKEELKYVAHVAFRAKDHATVDAFHAAGVAADGKDNGKPGIREIYHPTYYAAFVTDPNGNNIEVVCHA